MVPIRKIVGQSAFTAARSLFRMARSDWSAPAPWPHKVGSWSRGFRAANAAIYDLEHNNPADYVTDWARAYRCSKINPSLAHFQHKLAFRSLLLAAGVAQAETVAVLGYGTYLLDPLGAGRRYVAADELERILFEDGGRFIAKPESGNRGEGIFAIERDGGSLVRRRGNARSPLELARLSAVTMIERVVRQGAFWDALFPESANSIRVLTGWMPGEPRPFVLRAVQRIGGAATAPTDNWSGGGICALVDLETGRLGPGRANPLKSVHGGGALESHPDSGARIEGAVLPGWAEIREAVLDACASYPMHRYVGWDALVDDRGRTVILEGNGNSDVDLLQIHGGLLADPRARRFFEAYSAA